MGAHATTREQQAARLLITGMLIGVTVGYARSHHRLYRQLRAAGHDGTNIHQEIVAHYLLATAASVNGLADKLDTAAAKLDRYECMSGGREMAGNLPTAEEER